MTLNQFLELAVSLSIQVALVVAVTHWLGRLVRGDRTRCRLWATCFAAILVLLAAAVMLPHPRIIQPWANIDSQTGAAVAKLEIHLGAIASIGWAGGVLVSFGLFLMRWFYVHRFLRQCESIDEGELGVEGVVEVTRDRGKGKLGKASIRFLRSASLATPFCWQFHQPYIVLPAFLLKGHDKELNLIVRHELEHLLTGHPLQLFVQRVVEIVFWFHPMIWWASQQSALTREFACDEAAVREPSEIATYLRSLLKIVVRADISSSEGPTGLAFGGTKSIIAERARRLVRRAKREVEDGKPIIGDAGALIGLICLVAVTALLWLPVDVLASPQSNWSPWPRWTAAILHDVGVPARDFERYDSRFQLRDLLDSEDEDVSDRNVRTPGQ